jgi:hypothetical protein
MRYSGVGTKIGSIKCCAPTCADDIALTGSNPQDIQTMINIAYDFSQREGYSLQPTKSVILPMKTSNKISHEDETWTMNNNSMPKRYIICTGGGATFDGSNFRSNTSTVQNIQ